MKQLIDLIHKQGVENWAERCKKAFEELFGADGGRYPDKAKKAVTLRAPVFQAGKGVTFASLIHPANPDSGAYGGMSFVLFPVPDAPCLLAMVVGTQGLSPDEEVLARPGHGRKVSAICNWLNKKYGKGNLIAWAKQDPVRLDLDLPGNIKRLFPDYNAVFERYGRVIYGFFQPTGDTAATADALKAFLDLMFEERGIYPLKAAAEESEQIRSEYFAHLMPDVTEEEVQELLRERRFVVLQGPPGTGKTRLALRILQKAYQANGFSIQFHPNTTYENFIGGLAPVLSGDVLGFRFAPQPGFLMKAATEALKKPEQPFLLHIDEIIAVDRKLAGMRAPMRRRRSFTGAPILPVKLRESPCFEVIDSSTARLPATFLLKGQLHREPQSQAARLANQFIQQNSGILQNFNISANLDYDGHSVDVIFQAGTKIGAIPLLSPTSGRPDYGLIVKPRFDWPGIGSMLGKMGWRVIPSLLQLPLLPRSDRKIPPWVLSATVLLRIKKLLECLERRFEFAELDLSAPRGSVKWPSYITSSITRARFLHVPCRYPDLRDDREFIAAVHYTLRKQQASLESQRSAGAFVLQLIGLCQSLLERVRSVSPKQPSVPTINAWYRGPLRTRIFRDGLQAMEWTIEDRGLAGLGDLQGLPWVMSMEEFFEAWAETIAAALTRRIGGVLHTGRKRETVAPLVWDPPYVGSQKYLLPDLVLERLSAQDGEKEIIIFDAKYKGHWEDLSRDQWGKLDEELRERHRADLLQVLAYSTLFEAKKITSLVYPCQKQTWDSLKKRGLLYHKACLGAGKRSVNLVLAAIPMDSGIEEIVQTLATAVI